MYYEINVSKDNYHYFATAERSLKNEHQMNVVYMDIKQRFPASEGFKITVTRYELTGKQIIN